MGKSIVIRQLSLKKNIMKSLKSKFDYILFITSITSIKDCLISILLSYHLFFYFFNFYLLVFVFFIKHLKYLILNFYIIKTKNENIVLANDSHQENTYFMHFSSSPQCINININQPKMSL